MKTTLASFLRQEQTRINQSLQALRNALRNLKKNGPLLYEVHIISLWAESGEKSVTMTSRGDLKTIFAKAISDFKKINNRSDVQANYQVFIHLGKKTKIMLPEKYWGQYKDRK